MQPTIKYYEPISYSFIEGAITDLFYGTSYTATDEADLSYLYAARRSNEQVDDMVNHPESYFHKILPGYTYIIYLEASIMTGAGGAKAMLRNLLLEGMSEEQAASLIYVELGAFERPLNTLTIKEK